MQPFPASRRLVLPLVLVALFSPALRADSARPAPPRDVDQLITLLFDTPSLNQATLSPDGRHLAFIRDLEKRKVAGVYDLQQRTEKLAGLPVNDEIRWIRWVGNEQLIFGSWRAFMTSDVNLAENRNLALPPLYARWQLDPIRTQDPANLVLECYPLAERYPEVEILNLKSKQTKLVATNPGRVTGWMLDETGGVRIGFRWEPNEESSFISRDSETSPWRDEPLPKTAVLSFFLPDGNSILISYRDAQGRRVAQLYDLKAHQLTGEPLLRDASYDVGGDYVRDNQTGAPIGLEYESEKLTHFWFNPQYQKLHAAIQRSFPGQNASIVGLMPGNRVLFEIYSDVNPWAFYELDLVRPAISLLLQCWPDTAKYEWAPMKPVTFPARDGYDLHGYLTLPLGRKAGQPAALVVLPHDGPRQRSTWGFNPAVQFLASLGYSVLQVDYRGSSGYGQVHELKSTLEVCEKSVDDIADSINWAVKYGYADPKRIALYGFGYGGYISLALATRYPDLPAAAIGIDGIYDWATHYESEKGSISQAAWKETERNGYFVDPKAAPDRYRAFSPLNSADKVNCPVMLMRTEVDLKQTKPMAAALHDAGKAVTLLKDPDGFYGLGHMKERRTYYHQLAEFLLKNVPPGN